MRSEMHLTIQDYFNRRSAGNSSLRVCSKSDDSPGNGVSSFSKTLTAAQEGSASRGLSIQDYLRNRIRCLSPEVNSKTAAEAGLRKSPLETASEPDSVSLVPAIPDAAVPPRETIRDFKQASPARVDETILDSINKAAARYSLSPALIKAVIKTESDYRVRAVSQAGAQGLMQLMPATAREMGVIDPFDIEQNICGGAQYLRKMLDQFDGDVHLALSAYNAGPGTVARYGGKVPYAETRNYVQRVLHLTAQFSETSMSQPAT